MLKTVNLGKRYTGDKGASGDKGHTADAESFVRTT